MKCDRFSRADVTEFSGRGLGGVHPDGVAFLPLESGLTIMWSHFQKT